MNDLSAALLAGGRSRRMGTDKAFLPWQGRPLWEYQLEKLRTLKPAQLLLSCRAEQAFPELPDVTILHDEKENRGPLAGIARCLRACAASRLAVLGIDLPLMPADFLQMLAAAGREGCGTIIKSAEWYEPLAAVYPRTMLQLAEEHLDAGKLALQNFVRSGIEHGLMHCVPLEVEPSWFTNWNSAGDL